MGPERMLVETPMETLVETPVETPVEIEQGVLSRVVWEEKGAGPPV